jgi:hypothetical protein
VCGLGRFLQAFHMSNEILDEMQSISDRHRFHSG